MRRPSNNSITLGYGAVAPEYGYTADSPHLGTDFSFQPDPTIYAPEAGTVVFVGVMGTAGNAVELQGSDGRKWRFCHLQSFNVSAGQWIGEGGVIGIMGQTGYAFGRHLHLVLFKNGTRADPMSVLPSNVLGASTSQGESDMIRPEDAHIVRIISSEVKGWDFNAVHRGETDAREMAAWTGQPWTKLIQEAWLEKPSESFRYKRIDALNYYDVRRPQVENRITELQTEVDRLTSELTALRTAEEAEDKVEIQKDQTIAALQAELATLQKPASQPEPSEPIFGPDPTVPPAPADTPKPTQKQPSLLTRLILAWLSKFGKKTA